MTPTPTARRRAGTAAAAAGCLLLALTGCGQGASGADGTGDATTYTFWDPYPQYAEGDAWAELVASCGEAAGVTVERTAYDTTDLTNKVLLAAQQGAPPDVLVVDNPVVSTLAEAGVLTTTAETGSDVGGVEANLLAAGEVGGDAYGVPVGANTLALYYNATVLADAGVDPAAVTDWDSLTAALAAVTAAGHQGITFSAIGTEEGSFQFLPWFWGAGADLREIDSAAAVDALSLWTGWLQAGYAPDSVINNTQTTSWQEFATGEYAFAENGTWQLANARASGIDWGVITLPSRGGGTAASPTGGEFVTVPVQDDTDRYAVSAGIQACLTAGDAALTTVTTLSYVSARADVQQQQVVDDPDLAVWVEAVNAARGRTSDDLGTDYPVISEQLWTAVQTALSGGQDPAAALAAAQEAAAGATS